MTVSTRRTLRLLVNTTPLSLTQGRSDDTLLALLRLSRRLTGTKEGCAEGDCGACTVLVGRLEGPEDALVYRPVTSCIRLVPSLDGCHVVTIESLARWPGPGLHPLQEAMIHHHGSQCGFCTPGIIMALYALWLNHPRPTETQIRRALQGNLCRCTGYQPILEAARNAHQFGEPDRDPLVADRETIRQQLREWRDGARVTLDSEGGTGGSDPEASPADTVILPADAADLAQTLSDHPGATLVAGATDVGLWVTKELRRISPAVFIGHLGGELGQIQEEAAGLRIGALVSYADLIPALRRHFPHLEPLWWRIGGAQVRAMGTVGGNIANGSPIGDTPPGFITLGARLRLRSVRGRREIPLEAFFLAYKHQDRAPDEFVESLFVPYPVAGHHAVYKISKRRDEDISAVCGAFGVTLDGAGRVATARVAFGGMAATPKRASAVEAALMGQPWTLETIRAAQDAFTMDYQPLSDWRASAAYRLAVARNLLHRFWLESTGSEAVQLPEPGEDAA